MDNEVKKLNCIVCPMGCEITVEIKNKKIEKIEGNTCRRGELYVKEELTAPRRMLTASVRVKNGALPLLPGVSNATLPKEKILECAAKLRGIVVEALIKAGDIALGNIFGTGTNIVASRSMDRA